MPFLRRPHLLGTPLKPLLSVVVAMLLALLLAQPLLAAAQGSAPGRPVELEAGSGRMLTLGAAAANLFVADPKVVEARPASATSFFVFGVAPGRTTIAATDAAGHPVGLYEITVRPSSFNASEAGSAISRAMPGQSMSVEGTASGLEVDGHATTPADAERAIAAARATLGGKGTVDNRLAVGGQTQVLLRVRIAEMSRTLTRDLGLNWQNLGGDLGSLAKFGLATQFPLADLASGAGATTQIGNQIRKTSVEAILDALAQDQLVHILAEPNLIALSGESASFLVGGEFPIPTAQQQGNISVTFKQYGISLAFVPTVLDDGRINMRVRPEVSQLTDQGAVQISAGNGTLVIPALQVRRADTTVELGSGQSFAIAGLLSDSVTQTGSAVPFLGDTPILGALFRSDSFRRQQTELVILVTPFLVRPVSNTAALHLPTEGYAPPNDLERILLLRQVSAKQNGAHPAPAPHVPGVAGFLVQ